MLRTLWAAPVSALLVISFVQSTIAAEPSSGTLSLEHRSLSYTTGPMPIANASGFTEDNYVCDELNPCDDYALTIELPADFRTTHPAWRVRIAAAATPEAADVDLRVANPDGSVAYIMRDNPPAQPAIVFQPTGGTQQFRVQIVPGTPIPDSGAAIELYEDPAFISNRPDPVVRAGGPNFVNYTPGTNVTTHSADEPTMGINLDTNAAYMLFSFDVVRAEWDDAVSPPAVTWKNIGTGGAITTADPFMTVDQHRLADGSANPRVWIAQLMAASSYIAYTDNDGQTWTRSITGPGQVHGVDNQSIAVGPYPADGRPLLATAEHAMYYCSHEAVNAFCSRSDDGGATFGPSRPIFPAADLCSNHGHVKVGSDGTVFVPMNNTCQGTEGVSISIDAGETWHYIQVPGTVRGRWDSSIAMANDGKTVYYGYAEEGDDRPMIIKGTVNKTNRSNPTIDWQLPAIDVGAPAGLKNIAFPTVVAGDPDRAAFAFHGTTKAGDSGQISSMQGAEWYLYVAITFDGGNTWELRNVTPGNPTQRNDICDQGTSCATTGNHRNLLDFMDMDIDGEGRIIVGYADGCTGGCANVGGAANYSAVGNFARQIDGKRMYAEFDPVSSGPNPATPVVNGSRDAFGVLLTWNAVNAGENATIARYEVERAVGSGSFGKIAETTQVKYHDRTALGPATSYSYRIRAVNSGGLASDYSSVVAPLAAVGSACSLEGKPVIEDAQGDTAYGVSESHDIVSISIAEPYVDADTNRLVFRMRVADLSSLAPNSSWVIEFVTQSGTTTTTRYVEMKTDSTTPALGKASVSFEYGNVTGTASRSFNYEGELDPESDYDPATGDIFYFISASKIGNLAQNAALSSMQATAYQVVPGYVFGGGGGSLQPMDTTAFASYQRIGNASCRPNAKPVAMLSAQTLSEGAGTITVRLNAGGSTDADGDALVNYVFDFGDGSAPHGTDSSTVTHTYTGAGSQYAARVTVQDARGAISDPSTMQQIVVPNATVDTDGDGIADAGDNCPANANADQADADEDGTGDVCDTTPNGDGVVTATLSANPSTADVTNGPVTVTFTATASTSDPNGGQLSYTYYYGDGTNSGVTTSSTSTHVYDKAGTYQASAIVVDENNNSTVAHTTVTTTTTVTVDPGPVDVVAVLRVTLSGSQVPVAAIFDASGSTAPESAIYRFDFGNGQFQSGLETLARYTYTLPGSYTVTLTVTDPSDTSNTGTASATVTVTSAQQTTAQLSVSPSTAQVGQDVTFDASASIATTGRNIVSYVFDFGDGTTEERTLAQFGAAADTTTHAYSAAGTYTPSVTVIDDAQTESKAALQVKVEAPVQPPRRGGGAFGWLALLPLIGFAALRRR